MSVSITTLPRELILATARDLYAAYCASSGGLNCQGLPCPAWDALTGAVKGHWFTTASRAFELASYAMEPPGLLRPLPAPVDSLAHLPDPVAALATWQRYVSAVLPEAAQ